MPAYRARQCVQRSLRPSAGAALQMRPQDGGAARLALAALVLLLAADGGLAKKKKKSKKAKREWAKAKAPPPAPELPTEEGWAYMDDTTPVQQIFATSSQLAAIGEHTLAAEGFGQVLRIMPENGVARVNFATMLDKAGHATLALEHFAQVADGGNIEPPTQATARLRYGVLLLSDGLDLCTKNDRSALRHTAECNATKTERLDKGVHYLALLQELSAAEAEATAPSTAHQQALGTANRRLMGQALKFLGRFPEAIAQYAALRENTEELAALPAHDRGLYTFEYAVLMEEQGRYADGLYGEALTMTDTKAHARLCALEEPLARTVAHCRKIVSMVPEEQHSQPAFRQVYTALGKGLGQLGLLDEEAALYESAVKLGVYPSTDQRSGFRVQDLEMTHKPPVMVRIKHQPPVPDWKQFDSIAAAVAELEGAADTIREEFLGVVGGLEGLAAGNGFGLDVENLTNSGSWYQRTYIKDGAKIASASGQGAPFAETFPATTAIVDRVLGGVGGAGHALPESSVELSMMSPGTHVRRHCGPVNHKWRLHLALVVPEPEGSARLRVGSETLLWQEGKILLFDDSYEHEVWNDGETPRAVLIIDLWHPEIVDESVRDVIRSVLGIGAKGTTAEQMQRQ